MELKELRTIDQELDELVNLLKLVVDTGASIGFLPPLDVDTARAYWAEVMNPSTLLFIAIIDSTIVGTIQLHLCTKENGQHRAEIAKLMTHPAYRRKGIAKKLMESAEEKAKQLGRSLIILDTREGDPSNILYKSLHYIEVGSIPRFAQSANGELESTIIYYKNIT